VGVSPDVVSSAYRRIDGRHLLEHGVVYHGPVEASAISQVARWPTRPERADAIDRRGGTWTRLQLLEMDAAFCQAMRQAHPELERHKEPEQRLRRTA